MPVSGPCDFPAIHFDRRDQDGRTRHGRIFAYPQTVQHADRTLRGYRSSAGTHCRQHLCDLGAVQNDSHGRGPWRKARSSVGHCQVPQHRNGAGSDPGRDGHPWRQRCDFGSEKLPGPGLGRRADIHHRRGRQYPDAQPDDLRTGRHPLSSLRAQRNGGSPPRQRVGTYQPLRHFTVFTRGLLDQECGQESAPRIEFRQVRHCAARPENGKVLQKAVPLFVFTGLCL